jgi:hypothetical protein
LDQYKGYGETSAYFPIRSKCKEMVNIQLPLLMPSGKHEIEQIDIEKHPYSL